MNRRLDVLSSLEPISPAPAMNGADSSAKGMPSPAIPLVGSMTVTIAADAVVTQPVAPQALCPISTWMGKPFKLDYPRFDRTKGLSWLCKAEQFYDFYQVPEDQKLSVAFYHMDGRALAWFNGLRCNNRLASWQQFLREFAAQYGPSEFDNPFGELSKLQQTGSMEEYCALFDDLYNRTSNLPQEFLIGCFI